ncbi:MAG: hypothetical protein IT370_16070 [Deltaproteobacteria bacterium]|nr:hypothetical protein [Deltaproteobacteria bacterium]
MSAPRAVPVTLLVVSTLTLALPLAGCGVLSSGKGRPTGAVATGERLAVVDDIKAWTTTEQAHVGQEIHRDANGNVVAVSDLYADQRRTHHKPIWYPVQGLTRLADEDFFRITHDTPSLRITVRSRARARRQLRIGQIMVVGGAGAAIGALLVSRTLVKAILAGGGLVTACTGWYLGNAASKRLETDYHAVNRRTAEEDARRYNEGLGSSTQLELGVSGMF